MTTNVKENSTKHYSRFQLSSLLLLRMLIGWHLLYEGVVKIANPDWSAAAYLKDSKWIFAGLFNWIAAIPEALSVVNFINMWGLTVIGFALIAGLLTRYFIIGGIVLIASYYVAAPPLVGLSYMLPSEGSYLIVNKNLIEIAALLVLLALPTSRIIGLDRILFKQKDGGK